MANRRDYLKHLGFTYTTTLLIMKAQEARKLSLSNQNETAQKQTEEVHSKIKGACGKGEMNCVYFGSLLPVVIQKLMADGFTLSQREDNERGQCSTYYEISW